MINNYVDYNKYNSNIQIYEVKWIINTMKMNKACGVDGLDGSTVKLLYKSDQQYFHDITYHIWNVSVFPESWKLTNVILIPKDYKDLKVREN